MGISLFLCDGCKRCVGGKRHQDFLNRALERLKNAGASKFDTEVLRCHNGKMSVSGMMRLRRKLYDYCFYSSGTLRKWRYVDCHMENKL